MDEHRFQRGDRVVVSDKRHPHHGKQGAVVYVARGREGWLYQVDGLERRMPIFIGAQLTRVDPPARGSLASGSDRFAGRGDRF